MHKTDSEIDPHIYGELVLTKVTRLLDRKRKVSQTTKYPVGKTITSTLTQILHKN
jgi:hypothetical protein